MKIEELNSDYKEEVNEIINDVFGQSYVTADQLINMGSTIYVLVQENKVMGFITYKVLDNNEKSSLIELNAADLTVCKIGVLAIGSKYQKMGYGMKLMDFAINKIRSMSDIITMTAWEEEGNVNIGMIANNFNFQRVAKLNSPWSGSSCKLCGDNCECSGVLYKLVLNSKK